MLIICCCVTSCAKTWWLKTVYYCFPSWLCRLTGLSWVVLAGGLSRGLGLMWSRLKAHLARVSEVPHLHGCVVTLLSGQSAAGAVDQCVYLWPLHVPWASHSMRGSFPGVRILRRKQKLPLRGCPQVTSSVTSAMF